MMLKVIHMFKLKKYQERSIQELESYVEVTKQLESNQIADSYKIAFIDKTGKPYQTDEPVSVVPFVCIKIPTGGGKTVVACNMLNTIHQNFIQFDGTGLVIWLVPTDAIRSQTLRALRDRDHNYRKTLDKFFPNGVNIFDNQEALHINKFDIDENLSIIVSTFSAFKREQKKD